MAKISGVSTTKKAIVQKINLGFKNPELLKRVGEFTVKNIKGSTRSGKETASGKPLKPLKRSTIKYRDYIGRNNPVSSYYRASKSNLNLSGQLIDSIKYKIIAQKGLIEISPSGNRKPYKDSKGNPIKTRVRTNKEVGRYVSNDRPFMGLSEEMKTSITVMVRRFLRSRLR